MHSITSKTHELITAQFNGKALIGVVHCPAFPGSARYDGRSLESIYDACLRDVNAYIKGGLNGLIVENHGDIPFLKPDNLGPETSAYMSIITEKIIREVDCPVGVNVLANAANTAIAVASASGASFVRVNQWANAYVANEGIIEGRAGECLRYRNSLGAQHIKIYADSHVKHGSHSIVADRTITELTRDLAFFDADAVIATGHRTGNTATLEEICEVGDASALPLLVGSGVSVDNIAEILPKVDGIIIASSLKRDGHWWNEVQIERVKAFTMAARSAAIDA